MTDWQRPNVEAPLIVWEYVEAVERIADKREAERQQAIDALRQAQHQCRENIRRAAFAPQIGTRYTEKLRLAIADECRKLEDGIAAALVKLGEAA